MIIIDLLIIGGFIGIGIIIASLIVKDVRKKTKVKKHIDNQENGWRQCWWTTYW